MSYLHGDFYAQLLVEYLPGPIMDDAMYERYLDVVHTLPVRTGAHSALRTVLLWAIRDYRERVVEPRSVGDAVRVLIEQKGIKQADVAERTGIAASNLSAIIHHKRKLGKKDAVKLARFFKIPVEAFGSTYSVAAKSIS